VDDCHTRPERLARTVATMLGPDATVTLTPRRVQLHVTGAGRLPDVAEWQNRLAQLLYSVYLGRSPDALEGPVRAEIRQPADDAHPTTERSRR
jgi:hypothetical protein